MAEQSEQSTHPSDNPSAAANRDAAGKLRLKVLLALFGLALVGLGYDFLVARPGVERAYEKVKEANIALENTPLERLTNVEVQDLLGRQPTETYEEGPYTVELYAWTAGLPVGFNGPAARSPGFGRRTHDYYALYSQQGGELVFQTHFKFKLDNSKDTPVAVMEGAAAPEGGAEMKGGMMGSGGEMGGGGMGMGAGGGGGGMGMGGGGGGGGFDPAAIFARRDANQDGKLTGEELEGRIAARVEELDTDKNGEISREEFDAGMQNFGGGPGGGSPGGPGRNGGSPGGPGGSPGGPGGGETRPERPARPEIEDDTEDKTE